MENEPKTDRRGSKPGQFGQPPYERSDEVAHQVETMTGFGMTHIEMGQVLGVSPDTLQRHYPNELEIGKAKAKERLINRAYRMAMMEQIPEGVSGDKAYEISSRKVDFLLNVIHRVRPGTVTEFDGSALNVIISADDADL